MFFNHTLSGLGDNRLLVAVVDSNIGNSVDVPDQEATMADAVIDQVSDSYDCGLLGIDKCNCSTFVPLPGQSKSISVTFGNLTCTLTYKVSIDSPIVYVIDGIQRYCLGENLFL